MANSNVPVSNKLSSGENDRPLPGRRALEALVLTCPDPTPAMLSAYTSAFAVSLPLVLVPHSTLQRSVSDGSAAATNTQVTPAHRLSGRSNTGSAMSKARPHSAPLQRGRRVKQGQQGSDQRGSKLLAKVRHGAKW